MVDTLGTLSLSHAAYLDYKSFCVCSLNNYFWIHINKWPFCARVREWWQDKIWTILDLLQLSTNKSVVYILIQRVPYTISEISAYEFVTTITEKILNLPCPTETCTFLTVCLFITSSVYLTRILRLHHWWQALHKIFMCAKTPSLDEKVQRQSNKHFFRNYGSTNATDQAELDYIFN